MDLVQKFILCPWAFWANCPFSRPRYDKATGTFPDEVPMQAVRMGNWKAVRPKPGAPLELYDLSKDIAEKNDVAARFPNIVKKMEAICRTARQAPRPQKDIENQHWRI